MRIKLADGKEMTMPMSDAGCTGYVATEITLFEADVRWLAMKAARDRKGFQACMVQLAHRFPSARARA